MWQGRLLHYAVFTKASEEFAPHYLAEIRHDMRQTTLAQMESKLTVELIKLRGQTETFHRAKAFDALTRPLVEQSLSNINEAIMEDYPQR